MSAFSITGLLVRPDRLLSTSLPSDSRKGEAVHRVFEGDPAETLRRTSGEKLLAERVDAALPGEEVLIMVADLPTREPDEIDGMVSLRAEEISPFPVERTCAGWEALRDTDTGSRVLMALADLRHVQTLHDWLSEVRVLPRRVDVDVLGWLEVLREGGHLPEAESRLLLLVDGVQCHAVVWYRGGPCAIRSLGPVRELAADEVAEELRLALMSLESEWTDFSCDRISVWHDGGAPAWAAGELAGLPCDAASLEALPPCSEGVARRGLGSGALDLAPEQWKREAASKTSRLRWKRGLAAAAALWLLGVGALTAAVVLKARRVEAMRARLEERADTASEVQRLSRRVRSLSHFTDRSSSALETMRLLARAMPSAGALRIDDFRYAKDSGVVFSGETRGDGRAFYTFIEELGTAEVLEVENYDVKQQRGATRFQVNTQWSWVGAETEEGS